MVKASLNKVGYLCLGAWGVGNTLRFPWFVESRFKKAKELLKMEDGSTSDCPTLLEIDVGPAPSLGRMLVLPKIGVSGKTDSPRDERLSSGFLVNTIRTG